MLIWNIITLLTRFRLHCPGWPVGSFRRRRLLAHFDRIAGDYLDAGQDYPTRRGITFCGRAFRPPAPGHRFAPAVAGFKGSPPQFGAKGIARWSTAAR